MLDLHERQDTLLCFVLLLAFLVNLLAGLVEAAFALDGQPTTAGTRSFRWPAALARAAAPWLPVAALIPCWRLDLAELGYLARHQAEMETAIEGRPTAGGPRVDFREGPYTVFARIVECGDTGCLYWIHDPTGTIASTARSGTHEFFLIGRQYRHVDGPWYTTGESWSP
ncbi:MAG: hypothetical protein IPJ77_02085 [Planctomycetes bacterium]|nr:hypothetical protein [Planctomycetota bacterium]